MVTNKTDDPPDAVEAAKAVLVELVHILGEYRDDMVIVGGWVPSLLMPHSTGHVGSTDVNIALNHLADSDEVYSRISASLKASRRDVRVVPSSVEGRPEPASRRLRVLGGLSKVEFRGHAVVRPDP